MAQFSNTAITSLVVDRDRRDLDIDPDIVRIVADDTPWTVLLRNAMKQDSTTAEYDWYEEPLGGFYTTLTGTYADSTTQGASTTITCADTSIFLPNDVVKNTGTGECMLVSSVTNATTFVALRLFGSSGIHGAGVVGQNLVYMGSAFPEGSSAPSVKQLQPVKKTNWCQIHRTDLQGTGTADAEELRTNVSERQRLRVSKLIDHNTAIERSFLFGDGLEDATAIFGSTTGPQRATRGAINTIMTNVTNCGSALTESLFEQICEGIFNSGSTTKLLVASTRVISVINQFAQGKLKTVIGEDTYGVRLKHYISGHGDIFIAKSRALQLDYAYYGFFFDLDYIVYKALEGRDTKLKMNIQSPGYDGWQDEYLTECGLKMQNETAHGYFYNAAA